MILLRRVLFYIFLVIYLFVCPYIILRTLGVTFRPGKQTIERTGIIYITTIPSGADIYLNSRLFSEKTPTIIPNLRPAAYRVRAVLPGHRSWEKTLPVRIGKATVVENMLLLPNQWTPLILDPEPVKETVPLIGVPFVLVRKGPQMQDVILFRQSPFPDEQTREENPPESLKPVPLAAPDSVYARMTVRDIHTIAQSSFLLVHGHLNDQETYLWITLKEPVEIRNITELFPERPDKIVWASVEPNTIFTMRDGVVNRLDLKEGAIYPQILTNIETLDAYKDSAFALTRDHHLVRWQGAQEELKLPLQDSKLDPGLFTSSKRWTLHVHSEKLFMFLSDDGTLLSNPFPVPVLEKNAKDFLFDKARRQLLIWTDKDIGILDYRKAPEENDLIKEPPLTWLKLKQKNIAHAEWINDGEQILWQTDRAVYLTDTMSLGQPRVEKIADIAKNSRIDYSEDSGALFYLDDKRRLTAVKILPVELTLPIPHLDLEFTVLQEETTP